MWVNRLLYVVLLACYGTHAWSQSWCPPGAAWAFYYTYNDWFNSETRTGFLQSQYTGDVLIGGQLAQRISNDLYYGINGGPQDQHETLGPTYTRTNDGVVYIWNNTQYDTLLWLASELGDHWTPYSFSPEAQFFVTHIDTATIDGVPLRRSAISMVDMSTSSTFHLDTMYDRIGPIYSFLFYPYNIMVNFQQFSFRCYHDQDIDYSVWPDGCDFPLGQTQYENEPSYMAFPNPGSNDLHIEGTAQGQMEVWVTDATGRTMIRISAHSGKADLNTDHWAPGLYQVRITMAAGNRTLKWIKQ